MRQTLENHDHGSLRWKIRDTLNVIKETD
jgi:hypothetical protein